MNFGKGGFPLPHPRGGLNFEMQSGRESSGGFRQRLGNLFQNLGSISGGPSRPEEQWGQDQTVYLTDDILKELGPNTPIQVRIKLLKELHDIVANKHLEKYAIQALWLAIKDLLESSVPLDIRHFTLGFIRSLIGGQYEELGMLRAHFFQVVSEHDIWEDFQPCFDVVRTLTDSGKDILYLEQEMGPYLVRIIPRAMGSGRSVEYLTMVVNIIKHNAAYLDEEVLMKIIEGCCQTAITSSNLSVTELCLESLNAIICYSTLPSSALSIVTVTLCHTLNISALSKPSLEMMIRLLGTHVGMATLYTLCTTLQDKTNWGNPLLLRGGVFYISMSLWGVRRVESLKVSFASVLPAIRVVSSCTHTIVVYEIALSMLRLVRVYSNGLHLTEWELVYDILCNIQTHIGKFDQQINKPLMQVFHDLCEVIAEKHSGVDHTHSRVNPERFFAVIGKNTILHELSLVMKLLAYQASCLGIGSHGWVCQLKEFMERFYQRGTETAIRVEALNQLENLVLLHSVTYEDELLQEVVLPLLSPVALEQDPDICCHGVQLLVAVLNSCSPSWAPQTLGIINTVLQRGLEVVTKAKNKHSGETFKLPAAKAAICGLAPLLKLKLPQSSDVALQVFQLLVTYLLQLYEENCFIPATCVMRKEILNSVLSLRANEDGFFGYHDDTGTLYSSFYICQRPTTEEDHGTVPSCTSGGEEKEDDDDDDLKLQGLYLDYSKVMVCVVSCLAKEREWEVIVELLVGLRGLLENRTLVISSWSNFSSLCMKLCSIADNLTEWFKRLKDVPSLKSEETIASYLYPVLASFCTYGNVLDRTAQHQLICSLESSLVKHCSLLCIRALSIALLEMQGAMTRLLPRVLYRLGQISATPTLALPVLELLTDIIYLPPLYSGFVEQQYLGVFGTVLPYADPFKYNPYVVALAYHAISIWFLRCRIQYRPVVAHFVNKQLSTLLSVYQEVASSPTRSSVSSAEPRKRSSSFTSSQSQTAGRQRSHTHQGGGGGDGAGLHSKNENNLLTEMVEICTDMMARYTYSNISTQPIRSPGADFLVGNGPSKTWLVGNSLVTITTSGMGGGSEGVCPRCKALKQSLQPNSDVLLAGNESFLPTSRRFSSLSEGIQETAPSLCSCWCRGWSEIKVRRPTGNVAWLMRVQNKLDILATPHPRAEAEYDWSLTGVNAMTLEEEDEQNEDEWDVLNMSNEGGEISPVVKSHDQSLEQCVQSHDQSIELHAQSHDQLHEKQILSDDHLPNLNEISADERVNEAVKGPQIQIITSHRQPSSHSWSEGTQEKNEEQGITIASNNPPRSNRSFSTTSVELLPPLFSYDEGNLISRSPSLVRDDGVLSDPEQLELMASVSKTSSSVKDHDETTIVDRDLDRNKKETQKESSKLEDEGTSGTTPAPRGEESSADVRELVEEKAKDEEMEEREGSSPRPKDSGSTHSSLASSPKKPYHSSSPSRPRKRVMFSHTLTSSASQREELPADVYNNPSFIFLQLYHSSALGIHSPDPPVLLRMSESVERAIKVLDHIPPYNTHKIGVVYVGKEQKTEQEILSNLYGSSRYQQFLKGLGQLVQLRECPPNLVYLGGLDTSGTDGSLACFWEDDITQVIFHVATLMPTHPSNPNCSNKKLHIGNDFVTIVYNDSGEKYKFGTIKGQFNHVEVVVEPLGGGVNHVYLSVKESLAGLLDCVPCQVSDQWLPLLARQKAIMANLASLVQLSESNTTYYPSNWLGRLRQIKRIKERVSDQSSDKRISSAQTSTSIEDFTLYC